MKKNLCEATTSLLAKNEMLDSTYIRPIAFKAVGGINLDFREVPTWGAIVAFPYDGYFEKEGLDVCVSSWRRTGEPSVLSLAKASGHYINSVLAKVEAAQNGFDEAIFLDQRGFVSEGSGREHLHREEGNDMHSSTICWDPRRNHKGHTMHDRVRPRPEVTGTRYRPRRVVHV